MFRVRSVRESDVDDLYTLSRQAVFLNLPDDRAKLTQLVQTSIDSFQDPSRARENSKYVFVIEDLEKKKVVGSSSITAQHGGQDEPHSYFEVLEKKKVSDSLHIGFLHKVLRAGFDYDGPSEIGGLVLLPDYRGHKGKLGKFLSFVRFMYIAGFKERFKEDLLSELMPPFNERGESPIWESIGRKFTNLSYAEADRVSRDNKEFITSLFPEGDIYTCMLDPEARQAIGEVGDDTRPVQRMLTKIGFEYKNMIDPFDGGPHYWAKRDEVVPVKNTRSVDLEVLQEEDSLENCTGPISGIVMSVNDRGVSALQTTLTFEGEGARSKVSLCREEAELILGVDLDKTGQSFFFLPFD